jgi:hypothetical protein
MAQFTERVLPDLGAVNSQEDLCVALLVLVKTSIALVTDLRVFSRRLPFEDKG